MKTIISAIIISLATTSYSFADMDAAKKARENRDFKTSFALYLEEADKGNAEAQFYVGLQYRSGRGVPRSIKDAETWLLKSAEQGSADAQFMLGDLYELGNPLIQTSDDGPPKQINPTQDFVKALTWFNEAVKQKYSKAYYRLGMILWTGKEKIQANKTGACLQFLIAAHPKNGDLLNYKNAVYQLGHCYILEGEPFFKPTMAAQLFTAAAKSGHTPSSYELGLLYEQGLGVEKDPDAAFKHISDAANGGMVDAQVKTAQLYEHGIGIEQSNAHAYKWYRISSYFSEMGTPSRTEAIKKIMTEDEIKEGGSLAVDWLNNYKWE